MKHYSFNNFLTLLLWACPVLWGNGALATPPQANDTKPLATVKPLAVGEARFDEAQMIEFIDLFSKKHNWSSNTVKDILQAVSPNAAMLKAYTLAKNKPNKNWLAYRNRYLNLSRIAQAKNFVKENQADLVRAQSQFGVSSHIIASILAIESRFGKEVGTFNERDLLVNLAFLRENSTPIDAATRTRMDFYQSELAHFLLLTKAKRVSKNVTGSYAGAMGIPQFLPSQVRKYAIDFNGDGKVDPLNNKSDAIGSLANYLHLQGWQNHRPILWRITQDVSNRVLLKKYALNRAKPAIPIGELLAKGLLLDTPINPTKEKNTLVTVVDLPSPEKATQYRLGLQNFYVLTHYGHSFFYAQVVDEFAKEIPPLK